MTTNKLGVVISGVAVMVLAGLVMIKSGRLERQQKKMMYFGEGIKEFSINDLKISNEDGDWWVEVDGTKVPGEKELVENYLKRLGEIELIEKISQNPERFVGLGIGDSERVILTAGGKGMEIGEVAKDSSGTYVREINGGTIYKIATILDKTSLAKSDFWEIKMVTNWPRSQVSRVTISGGTKNKSWAIEDDKKIEIVCYLVAEKFLGNFETKGSKMYQIRVPVENNEKKLTIGVKTGKKTIYWATVDEKKYFQISKSDFYSLTGVVR